MFITYFIFLFTQMFDRHLCWQQLKYSGMLETVKYGFIIFDFLNGDKWNKSYIYFNFDQQIRMLKVLP